MELLRKIADALVEKIDDKINPIVVKELRQAMRSKFIILLVMLFLAVQIIVLASYVLMDTWSGTNFYAGRNLFLFTLGVLMFTSVLCLPAYAATRMSAERANSNVDLLFITALPPRSIVSGKFQAVMALVILLYSACMPFMTFTYMLRGIDIPAIFTSLSFSLLMVSLAVMGSIFYACLPGNKILKIVLGLGFAYALFSLYIMSLIACGGIVTKGIGSDFWQIAVTAVVLTAMGVVFFYLLSVALITPASANRALPVRLCTFAVWLIGGAIALMWTLSGPYKEPIIVWCIISASVCSAGLLMAVSERDEFGARVAGQIPRSKLLRIAAFFFYSGAAGGTAFFCVLIVLSLATTGIIITSMFFTTDDKILIGSAGMVAWTFTYSMLAVWLRRKFLAKHMITALNCLLALGFMFLGTIAPLILVASLDLRDTKAFLWALNPFGGFFIGSEKNFYILWTIICTLFSASINLPWFQIQLVKFLTYEHDFPPSVKEHRK